jgi:DNA polymerase-4
VTTTGERHGPPPDGSAGFVHVDMDAFYASVEMRRRPDLRGQPVIVGGEGERGVVAAASYEARAFGIRSAMPSTRARRLCPHAVFLPGDHRHYSEVSAEVMAIMRDVTPLVEPLSLDEAFLDVRGVVRMLGRPREIASRLRARILVEQELTASIGIASTKFLAKLATERAKPRASPDGPIHGSGIHEVEAGGELEFLHRLDVSELWGVGPATLARLSRMGIETVGDLASLPESRVVAALGTGVGGHLHRLSRGVDDRPVVVDRPPKSISQEETFARDLVTRTEIDREAIRLADALASRLREANVRARTIAIKVRFADFETITRSVTGVEPIDGARAIVDRVRELLTEVDPTPGVRLFGVAGSGLVDASTRQLTFDDVAEPNQGQADEVIGRIKSRFGERAIGPAVLASPGEELGVREPGTGQWGPRT